ncbi:Rpn family recombination-promoting nuclease/putative transposase [Paenibacillaceae bacterium WGS1546]|uniref:Rpn family recombination-promoting nuclease/putative transposase n=1 Tax=Cohnella sp. WGS1546 TaxID=3366810 RepID=UPI00372D80BA
MGIDHDRLYKELLQTFFKEFMELFFPDISKFIDYSHVKLLSQELFSDIARGTTKRVDVLIETKLLEEDGVPGETKKKRALIIVHLEPQSYYQFTFSERMFLYSGKLYEKYRRRIVPIAIFSHRRQLIEPSEFSWRFPFLDVLRFRYLTVQLKKRNWRTFLGQDNPVAAALLSSLDYNKAERVQVKLEFLRMITRMKLDPARIKLLAVFFESYLQLTKDEEAELEENLDRQRLKEESELMEWMTSWEIKGMKKGLKEGREEGLKEGLQKGLQKGKLEGKQEVALKMLEKGMDAKTIREVTGLSPKKLAQLRESLVERIEEPSPY